MPRVIALLSGGVDSSVAAALLKERGFDVVGVYILGWTGTDEFPCSWQNEQADAEAVAKKLGIPFYTVNLSKEYEQEVIERFFAEYNAGRTPNPDILCNREIKFKHLLQAVRQFEPDFVATGHYAAMKDGVIVVPKDKNKDQTYFLWGIDKQVLPKILFPLGDLTKKEVRELAKKYGLPTAAKKDSQGICFVGPLKVREFLKSRVHSQPGQAILPTGEVVAEHDGIEFYTIGQRLGAGSVAWTGDVPPLFVAAKDQSTNTLVVSGDHDTYADAFTADQANWQQQLSDSFDSLIKVRYRQEGVQARVTVDGNQLHIQLAEPVRAITPGQSVVFYKETGELLGGAVIAAVPKADELVQKVHEGRARQTAGS